MDETVVEKGQPDEESEEIFQKTNQEIREIVKDELFGKSKIFWPKKYKFGHFLIQKPGNLDIKFRKKLFYLK